jgi:hypothetical protein
MNEEVQDREQPVMTCPRCKSPSVPYYNEDNELVCLCCGYVFYETFPLLYMPDLPRLPIAKRRGGKYGR